VKTEDHIKHYRKLPVNETVETPMASTCLSMVIFLSYSSFKNQTQAEKQWNSFISTNFVKRETITNVSK
jgi:competence transcription factor ComK